MVAIDSSREFDPFCWNCGRDFVDTTEYTVVRRRGVITWRCRDRAQCEEDYSCMCSDGPCPMCDNSLAVEVTG